MAETAIKQASSFQGSSPSVPLMHSVVAALAGSEHIINTHPGADDNERRTEWVNSLQALLSDIELAAGAIETPQEMLDILSDSDFENQKNDKRLLTGRLVAVSQIGPTFACIGLQNGFGKELSLDDAKTEWEANHRDAKAHQRETGYLRETCGIERLFLPHGGTANGVRMLRSSSGLVGKHVRVWKTVEPFTDSSGQTRKKRVAVHIDEIPTDFQFRRGLTLVKDKDLGDPFDDGGKAPSSGISLDEWKMKVTVHNATEQMQITDDLVAKAAGSLGLASVESATDEQRNVLWTVMSALVA